MKPFGHIFRFCRAISSVFSSQFSAVFYFCLGLFFLATQSSYAQLCQGSLGSPVFWEDFGAGATLYGPALPATVTAYPYQSGPPSNGTYVISNTGNPSGAVGYVPDDDHTGNPNGYMMVVNSDYAQTEIYRKNATGLCPNTTYVFSAFLANNNTPTSTLSCGANYIFPNVKFQVEYPLSVIQGSVTTGILPVATSNSTLNWIQYGFVFTTGPAQTSCAVVLINNAPGGCGNDYVVDDITLSPCGPGINLSVSPSSLICLGQPAVFQSSFSIGSYTVPQYQWQYSSNGSSWTNINAATSANYSLSAVSTTDIGQYRLLAAENGNILSPNCRVIGGPIAFSVSPANLSVTSVTSCPSQTVLLTASGMTSYTWSSGALTPTLVVSSGTSTTYTVTGTNGICNATVAAQLSIVPVSTITLSGSQTVCAGTSVSLTVSGASAYTWSPGNVNGPTFTTSPQGNLVVSVSGISTLTGACQVSQTATITVLPPLGLNVSAGTPSACVGNSISLSALASGGSPGYVYNWTGGPSGTVYAISQPQGVYAYSVTATDAMSCTVTASIAVSFSNNPVISVTSLSVCPGATANLLASGAFSYTWLPSFSTGSTYSVVPVSTTVYSVNGTASTGCSGSASATVTLLPTPTLSFSTYTITCANLGSATVTPVGGIGPFSYSWAPVVQTSSIASGLYPGSYTLSVFDAGTSCTSTSTTFFTPLVPFSGTITSTSSLICNSVPSGTAAINLSGGSGSQSYVWTDSNLSTQTSVTASALSAGLHTVSVTDAVTFCNVTQTFQITQPPALTLTILPSATMACVNNSVTLTAGASGGIGGYSYTWTSGPVSMVYPATQTTGGTYNYTVQVSDANSCSTTSEIPLVFVDYPIVSVGDVSICAGKTATLSATGAMNYTWIPGGSTSSTMMISPANSTFVTVTGGNFGCNTSAVVSVTVFSLPVASISGTNVVCDGQFINLNGTGGTGFNWTGPLGVSGTGLSFSTGPVGINQSGIYSLTVTSSDGCTSVVSQSVTVLPKPLVSVTGASVCLGMSAGLTASGGQSYAWSGPSGYTASTPSILFSIVNNGNAGIYTVVVTGANSCVADKTVQLTGYPYELPVPVISGSSTVCLYGTASFQGSGGVSYVWTGPGGYLNPQQSAVFVAGSSSLSGTYTLSVRNNSNCVASTTIALTVFPLPSGVLVSSVGNKCVPFCTELDVKLPPLLYSVASIRYDLAGMPISDTAMRYCFTRAGDYRFGATIRDVNGCVNTASLQILAWPVPVADFEFSPAEPVENGDPVIFTNRSMTEPLSYNWYFTQNGGFISQDKNAEYLYEKAGSFPVALVVRNAQGCLDTIVKYIYVKDDFSFYMPNSFTPDGDGMNDVFQPKGKGVVKYRLDIFDRWGERLFTSENFLAGWDGTFRGQLCKTDVYVWKVELMNASAKIKSYEGHVNLLQR